jgi:membrane peptidoglycan carboxypeptidase
MGVWAGNDNNSPMINITGVQGAAPIWHDAMLIAEQGHPIRDFQNPGGLVLATITYPDGVTSTDWYFPTSIPNWGPQGVPTPPTTSGPQPGPQPQPISALPTPYCSTFSFAFAPPPGNAIPANGDWW